MLVLVLVLGLAAGGATVTGTAIDAGIGGAGGNNDAAGAGGGFGGGASLFMNTTSATTPRSTVPIANAATSGTMLAGGFLIWMGTGFV